MNSVQEMNQQEKRALEEKLYVLQKQQHQSTLQSHALSVQDLQEINQDLDQFIQSQIYTD